jgi:hypothetical protein
VTVRAWRKRAVSCAFDEQSLTVRSQKLPVNTRSLDWGWVQGLNRNTNWCNHFFGLTGTRDHNGKGMLSPL